MNEDLLDPHGDDGADEVDELRSHDPVVGVHVDGISFNDTFVHTEHDLDVPSLVIGLVCKQWRNIGLGSEHNQPEGPLLVVISCIGEGSVLLGLLYVGDFLFRGKDCGRSRGQPARVS